MFYFVWEDQSNSTYCIFHTVLISCITVLYTANWVQPCTYYYLFIALQRQRCYQSFHYYIYQLIIDKCHLVWAICCHYYLLSLTRFMYKSIKYGTVQMQYHTHSCTCACDQAHNSLINRQPNYSYEYTSEWYTILQ